MRNELREMGETGDPGRGGVDIPIWAIFAAAIAVFATLTFTHDRQQTVDPCSLSEAELATEGHAVASFYKFSCKNEAASNP